MRTQARADKPKKMVIKPLKVKPKLPQDFEEKTWEKLKGAVHAVQHKRSVTSSLEDLYRAVEDMCMHKMASRLYTQLQNECDLHIGQIVEKLTGKFVLDPVGFLQHVEDTWTHHCSQMLRIRSIFLVLDRTYVLNASGVKSLFDMGLQLFRVHLSVHPDIEKKMLDGILMLVKQERNGDAVDRSLLKTLLRMLNLLGTYEAIFQDQFLSETALFYQMEAEELMKSVDVPEYLQHCEKRLGEEYERSEHYLDRMTRRPLIQTVERELLENQIGAVMDKGFNALMDAYRVGDLGRLYNLCGRIGAHESLKNAFQEYIRKMGSVIMLDEEKDKEMVVKLLDFKGRLDAILSKAFQSNKAFLKALKEAFEKFINQRQNKPAELTAKFIDGKLRAGNKGQTEEELEATLDRVLMIFRLIHGKDVFEAFYKKDLAKRLLLGKSASIDAEKSMIGKLKAECGSQFTNKLEGMFKDMDLSKDVMKSFKQSQIARDRSSMGIEMNVHVLTSGYWPTYPVMEARLPMELGEYQETFKQFYLQKHNGRRLQWYNFLGMCTLKARFNNGMKELQVSMFQAVVLMLFNEADAITYQDIREGTGIDERELKRVLQSLAIGKVRILQKDPKVREVKDGDIFRFNDAFTDPHFRIKVNSIQMKETEEENTKVNDAVMQDRQYQIDAAVVRVMKMRKTLSHKLLMQELLSQLKFPLKMTDVKRRIESLIEREYLERDPNTSSVYNYLA